LRSSTSPVVLAAVFVSTSLDLARDTSADWLRFRDSTWSELVVVASVSRLQPRLNDLSDSIG